MKVGISIIIPVYNVEKYLRECLDSVLRQTFSEYEAICVNDGSLDCSGMILEEYAKKSDKIRVLHQTNQGVSNARNAGILQATGKYICFLDGDDMLAENALERMWEVAEQEDIDILTYEINALWYENIYLRNKKNADEYCHIKKEYKGIRSGREFFVEMMEQDDFIDACWLMLIRLEWLRKTGIYFYPNAIFEDSIYELECYFQCERMKHVKDGLYIYRIRSNSTMTEQYTYKHLYYRIWQFSKCLGMLYRFAENEREAMALSSMAQRFLVNIKYIDGHLEWQEKKEIYELKGVYGLIAQTIGIGKVSTDYSSELKLIGLQEEMKHYPKVLLYGAGIIGNKVKSFMDKHELQDKLIGFAVSQKQEVGNAEGVCIKAISEYEASDEILLIIAAREAYHKEMLERAKECGYTKIRLIDCDLECMLDRDLL